MKIPFDNFQISEENKKILCNNNLYYSNNDNIDGNSSIKVFEKEFADFINTKYCIKLSSGINVLKIALESLGIKKNEEILVQGNISKMDFIYLIKLGYKFKCLDIDPDTLMVDVTKIEQNIEKITKVIIVSHLYGNCADMDNIMKIAEKYNLYVIEDATNAIGSLYKKKKLGSIGHMGCFSLNAQGNLKVLGNCAAITTNDEKLYKELSKKNIEDVYLKKYILPNSLDHIQAHMLKNNLTVLDHKNNMRQKIRESYKKYLSEVNEITILKSLCNSASNVFVIKVIGNKTRDKLRAYLNNYKINTKIHINIENLIGQWSTQHIKQEVRLINIQSITDCILYLPMYAELSEENVKFISQKIKKYFHRGNLMKVLYKKVVNDLSIDETKTYKFSPINKEGFMVWFKDDRTTKIERKKARVLLKSKRITF